MKKLIFIDADDTLWENDLFFRKAEEEFAALLAPHADVEQVRRVLWQKQEENIPWWGYGSKTYLLGMLDAALEICGDSLDGKTYREIKAMITRLAFHKLEVWEGVEDTLAKLSCSYDLILTTKGDVVEQLVKARKSGLMKYFRGAEVLPNKDEADYLELAVKYGIAREDIIMVGNSVRSDIIPVINIGGIAVYIPCEILWTHEQGELPQSDRLIQLERFSQLTAALRKF